MKNEYEKELETISSNSSIVKSINFIISAFLGISGSIITIGVWFVDLEIKTKIFTTIFFIIIILLSIIINFLINNLKYKKVAIEVVKENTRLNSQIINLNNKLNSNNNSINDLTSNRDVLLNSNNKLKKKYASYRQAFNSIEGFASNTHIRFPQNEIAIDFKIAVDEEKRKLLLELEE